MKPEAQRIAIAEACGWKRIHRRNCKLCRSYNGQTLAGYHNDVEGSPCGPTGNQWTNAAPIPDYLNDLNAMHEAEKALVGERIQHNYFDELSIASGARADGSPQLFAFTIYTATAAQRAESFLRTLNKWEDEA